MLEEAELGIPSDGHVCINEAKHRVASLDLGRFNEMMPVVQLLSTVDQCGQEFVSMDGVAKFIDSQCQNSPDRPRLAAMITLDGKWSVAVRGANSPHLLHFDPHVADNAHLDQSPVAVLKDGADLVQIMTQRGAYFPESRGAVSPGVFYGVLCVATFSGPSVDDILAAGNCLALHIMYRMHMLSYAYIELFYCLCARTECHSLHMQRNCPMSCSGIASGYQMIIPKMPPGAVLGVLHRRHIPGTHLHMQGRMT